MKSTIMGIFKKYILPILAIVVSIAIAVLIVITLFKYVLPIMGLVVAIALIAAVVFFVRIIYKKYKK